MSLTVFEEIDSCLKHCDFSLARRRTLDVTLDSGNPTLIKKAIQWSREFKTMIELPNNQLVPGSLLEEVESIVREAKELINHSIKDREAVVTAENISKTYRKGNFSLSPINISVSTGKILGVVGENGNGKTTLLRCLSGQLALDSGNIQYHLIKHQDYYSIKNHIAFIPQRIPRWHGQLKDNLHFSAAIAGVNGEENKLMVDFMLERFNLTQYAELTWNQISSGYRTRFEIARILLQKPRLLILDEPLANLDINAQQTLLTDLTFMAKGLHNPMGVVLSSQQLHEVEKVADTVLFIKNGTCLFSSNDKEDKISSFAIELETDVERDFVLRLFEKDKIEIRNNGGFYTLISAHYPAQQMIEILIENKVLVSYFRDITYSTKRFF